MFGVVSKSSEAARETRSLSGNFRAAPGSSERLRETRSRSGISGAAARQPETVWKSGIGRDDLEASPGALDRLRDVRNGSGREKAGAFRLLGRIRSGGNGGRLGRNGEQAHQGSRRGIHMAMTKNQQDSVGSGSSLL